MNYLKDNIHKKNDITFDVIYTKRRTLEIAVLPDESIVVKAPKGTELEEIVKRIHKRNRWIKKQQVYFRQFKPRTPPRKYIGGESHPYLGRQYRLKVISGNIDQIKLSGGFFWVTCSGLDYRNKVKNQLQIWYRDKAKKKFHERIERYYPAFKRSGMPVPHLMIRKMSSRWGSLSPRGTLTLNLDLIKAPKECIDYVITHELCHLKYQNHGPNFLRLLERVMPDWEKRKHKLELALI